jgi:hypothetical protein
VPELRLSGSEFSKKCTGDGLDAICMRLDRHSTL